MPSNGKKKKKVSTVKEWRNRSEGTELMLPSGNMCLARRVGMLAFLEQGAIPDFLAPIVNQVIRDKEYMPPETEQSLIADPEALLATNEMLDRCLILSVLEPPVSMPPGCAYRDENNRVCGKYLDYNDGDLHNHNAGQFDHDFVMPTRDEEVLYADEVSVQDKTFILNWSVGGGADLDKFRQQYAESVERVANLQGIETETLSDDGDLGGSLEQLLFGHGGDEVRSGAGGSDGSGSG